MIVGGKGTDSIKVGTAAVASVAGGGLADTIRLTGAFAGGRVYGDSVGTTAAGTGTGGAADGNDLITNSAAMAAGAAASIYGAGGNDTITLAASSGALLIDGGAGADVINGNAIATSIYGLGTITGGAGNDTLNIQNTSVVAGVLRTGLGTLSGGAGTDLIKFSNSGTQLSGAIAAGGMSGNVLGIISGVTAGDRIRLFTGVGTATFLTSGQTNWNTNGGGNATFIVLTAASAMDNMSQGGTSYSLSVFSNGTDSIINLYGQEADSTYSRYYIAGKDLVTTTNTGAVTATSTNFSFSIAAVSGGGLDITFS
jgi:hypothetical protein